VTVPTVVIGTIGRPHGIAGAVHSRASGPTLETIAPGDVVEVRPRGGEPRRLTVESRAGMADQPILRFAGVEGRDAASALTGAAIAVEADRVRALDDPDTFFVRDLIGCAVLLGDTPLGPVTEVHAGPANDALEVAAAEGPVLVPFTGDAVRELDLPGRRIVLRPDLLA
jgi:16S rRNA processing protein RimM